MQTKMNIPDTINVGYQERGDTYTGKLAYVVYTDAKGVLRKKNSWDGWRDHKIKPDTFKNEPISGFVLNRGVGGARRSYSWNVRNEYIRVYDPRDFEFEISVTNLLFILQECTSTKGKGLEGEFVYSWSGKELVLLPVDSPEYQECVKYTKCQTTKVTKNDMVEGCLYLMRDMTEVMYLGRHEWHEVSHDYGGKYEIKNCGKQHVFLNKAFFDERDSYGEYTLEKGFVRLAKRLSTDPLPQYADVYDRLKRSLHCLPPTKVELLKLDLKKEDLTKGCWWNRMMIYEYNEKYFVVEVSKRSEDFEMSVRKKPFVPVFAKGKVLFPKKEYEKVRSTSSHWGYEIKRTKMSLEELQSKSFYDAYLVNDKNLKYKMVYY